MYLQSEKRDKLDPKAIKCYFIGYGCEKYGYRIWDPKNRVVIRHCDVTFDEKSLDKDNFDGDSIKRGLRLMMFKLLNKMFKLSSQC